MWNPFRKRELIYVAMSGGVDSSTAAAMLKRHGHQVVGVFMRPWAPPGFACGWEKERADAERVAAHVGIEFHVWDFSQLYGEAIAEPTVDGYRAGVTPNPDVECNRLIKFGAFYDRAMQSGADAIATGHYARIIQRDGHPMIADAVDGNKDQTYFLWRIPAVCLSHVRFPLGGMTKPDVRRLAHRLGIPVADKKDSQGVCFIGQLDFKAFLERGIDRRPGRVVHVDGRTVGEHDGAAYYTIGQRHGMNLRDGHGPYYVVAKDMGRNQLTVGDEEDLYGTTAKLVEQNWLAPRPKADERIDVQIRYRSCAVPAQLGADDIVRFAEPVRAISPGQSAVIYRDGLLLGGGIIA